MTGDRVRDWNSKTSTASSAADRQEPAFGRVIAAALLAAALGMPLSALAATYKWVDEKGVVHYTDKLPPEEVNKGTVELNKEGVPVKKTEAAPTPEQRRAKAEEEERRKQQAKQQEEQDRRDRALLSSYTSESEIELARNRSLQAIDSVMKSAQAYTDTLTRRKKELESKIKAEYSDKPAPAVLERELEGINAELGRQADLIALKKRETAQVNAKYDADKERWRALIAAKGAEPATAGTATQAKNSPDDPYPALGNARPGATPPRH